MRAMYNSPQCLLYCAQSPARRYLVTATGSYISTFHIDKSEYICSWPPRDSDKSQTQAGNGWNEGIEDATIGSEAGTPPSKRPKLCSQVSTNSSTEIVVDEIEKDVPAHPPVIKLAVSRDGRHVIAITGEDKCLRVFELSFSGVLSPISKRYCVTIHIIPKYPV